MNKSKYSPGDIDGNLEIIGSNKEKGYLRYEFRCLKCGKVFFSTVSGVDPKCGCLDCKNKERELEKIKDLSKKYVGNKYSHLTIQDILAKDTLVKNRHGVIVTQRPTFARCMCDCGNVSDILLTKVVNGVVKQCDKCISGYLQLGAEATQESRIVGTTVHAIKDSREINKNNSTGYRGVSKCGNRYRAYINLARKQINIGLFDTAEEAAEARKYAEETIYKPIIEKWEKEHGKKVD